MLERAIQIIKIAFCDSKVESCERLTTWDLTLDPEPVIALAQPP
jgi:hypothetical protein